MRLLALGLAVLGWLLAGAPAAAALLTLTQAQQADALRVGQRSVTSEAGFDAEWRVGNAAGESLTVITPFYRLALAARQAAFRNEVVKPQDRARMLDDLRGRLTFWVHLHGPRENFARYYAPRLLVDDFEIEPAFVQNERTGLRQDNGSFLARSIYAFPTKGVTEKSKVVLVIRDPEGQLRSRFAVDLARMR
jgi:hypothetical protein